MNTSHYIHPMTLHDFPVQMHLHSNGDGSDLHAIGAQYSLKLEKPEGAWDKAKSFFEEHKGQFIFSAFSYELKDDLEDLNSDNPSFIPFPSLLLFVPKVLFIWEVGEIEILALNDRELDVSQLRSDIIAMHEHEELKHSETAFHQIRKEEYITQVSSLIAHIQRGDIYEANYCQELRAENVSLNPWTAFNALNERTVAPFACHLRINELHLLCGSPELFLEKSANTVISKPIKGTRKRSLDPMEDEQLKQELENDLKERAENIMITDLVRNDLSRTALSGSVKVDELCEIYSFKTVHQMISTVRSEVPEETHPLDIIKACFPMGSMTGAPKIRAMQLIEEKEAFKRGIYSGAVGLFTPSGDFVLNVVIRSILYDTNSQKASVAAGGAITALSDPEAEYEESLLKAKAMMEVLGLD